MFLFGWGLEFLGWCIGWFILGIIHAIISIRKLIIIALWCLMFRLNLQYELFTDDNFCGLIFLISLPLLIIFWGYKGNKKKS